MKKRSLGLCLVLLLWAIPARASLPREVTVRLLEAHPAPQELTLIGPSEMRQPLRQHLPAASYHLRVVDRRLVLSSGQPSRRVLLKTDHLVLQAGASGLGLKAGDLTLRRYPGLLDFSVDRAGAIRVSNRLPAQPYVALVVASETMPGWPVEALKAQAVLTQTRLARYKPGDALGDSTSGEAYLGLAHRRAEVDAAVRAVWDQVLTYDNRPSQVFYHAACAGGTSDAGLFTGKSSPPYSRHVTCTGCRNAPLAARTVKRVDRAAFEKTFGSGLPEVLSRDAAGRPRRMRLSSGEVITGYALWLRMGQRFGWDKAPGTRFTLAAAGPDAVQITSTGGGHGVGLCQWGAAAMARSGKTYRQILQYYFPGTRLEVN